jgi:hypothetical protein
VRPVCSAHMQSTNKLAFALHLLAAPTMHPRTLQTWQFASYISICSAIIAVQRSGTAVLHYGLAAVHAHGKPQAPPNSKRNC